MSVATRVGEVQNSDNDEVIPIQSKATTNVASGQRSSRVQPEPAELDNSLVVQELDSDNDGADGKPLK